MNLRTIAAAAALIASAVVGILLPGTDPAAPPGAHLPLCATDAPAPGDDPCVWQAWRQGNGEGRSFVWDGATFTYAN